MTLREVKREFFAHRNGITADVLRKGGSAFRTIFGVEVAALMQMARNIGKDAALARTLWEDADVRESRLLSYCLMDPAETDADRCLEMAHGVRDREDALMLAFRVLKRRDDSHGLLRLLEADPATALAAAALRQHLDS